MNNKDNGMKEFDEFDEMFEDSEEMNTEDDEAYEMPAEWDASFRAIFDQKYEEHKRKRRNRVLKKLSVAAGVLLVIFAGTGLFAQKVEGNGIPKLFEYVMEIGGYKKVGYNTNEEFSMNIEDEDIFFYNEDTIEQVQREAHADIEGEMFLIDEIPIAYEVENAYYDRVLRIMNIEIKTSDGNIYIYQSKNLDEGDNGIIVKEGYTKTIQNKNLKTKIDIYKSMKNDSYVFGVKKDYTIFMFVGEVSLETCIQIAEGLVYR